ncbi:hypothetical protein BC832DRAFT_128309 [Gaertneriomyces semiglobifer]|nr:hypothetical protein BC832DRAFT_128309 [Gaertneriomyces semiglobifer]
MWKRSLCRYGGWKSCCSCSGQYAGRSLSSEDVLKRFQRFGGVPRYVLEKYRVRSAEQDLERALGQSDLDKAMCTIGAVGASPTISDMVLHIAVDEGLDRSPGSDDGAADPDAYLDTQYVDAHYIPASEYVCRRITDYLVQRGKLTLKSFVLASGDMSAAASFRGKLFESWAHDILCQGGRFPTISLEDSSKDDIVLPKREIHRFRNVSEIEAGKYNIPMSDSFGAVDATSDEGLFQMTLNLDHGIKAKKLADLEGHVETHKLYFVVPEDMLDRYKTQPFLAVDGSRKVKLSPWVKGIKQYALGVRLDMA